MPRAGRLRYPRSPERMKLAWWAALLTAFTFFGCGRIGYEQHQGADASVDARPMNVDAALDAGLDQGVDQGIDAGLDAGDGGAVIVPGVIVTPTSGLLTSETGGTDTFTVVLNVAPAADVTVALTSLTPLEATVSPAAIVFTSANWASAQTVTVTGVDDFLEDGDAPFSIGTENAVSADLAFDGLVVADVTGINRDDETAGVLVSPVSGLVTSEAGETAMFTLVLQSAPTANVAIAVASTDITEGTVPGSALTFTPLNWNVAQSVTVTGVDDEVTDGDQDFMITVGPATSLDANYDGLSGDEVSVTNTDDETAGFVVTPMSGLVTTEGGSTDTFTVVLRSSPSSDVVFAVTSTRVTEGTVSPATLTFTTATWSTPQTVSVTGVNDAVADGDQAYEAIVRVSSSADTDYAGLSDKQVQLVNVDDESAGITVSPTTGLMTTEAGGIDTFTLVLNSEPAADVTISLASDVPLEGTVLPASVTFTNANWDTPQTVTVTGVDDDVVDGSRVYHIVTSTAVSSDPNYSGNDVSDVTATNVDDDSIGATVMPTSALSTSEGGLFATFTIVLDSEPTANVVFNVSSSDATEGTVLPTSVTFTTANWDTPQTITVTGVDDSLVDGDIPYTVLTAAAMSTDMAYDAFNPSDVSVTNTDNDVATVVVMPTSGLITTEAGGTAAFTIVLGAQPVLPVTISIASSDATEGSVSHASVMFTNADWNMPQTVTVTGVDDGVVDGSVMYTVTTGAAASGEAAFNGLAVTDVSVTNTDDDTASVIVMPTSGLLTTEVGATDTFAIALSASPSDDVTISLTSSDVTEGSVSPGSVTFTSMNWNMAQTVTVTGVDDVILDGTVGYTIVTSAAVSTDGTFNGVSVADVSVNNTDNEVLGIESYIKASNTGLDDRFGFSVALSADGNTLAVGAVGEASNATGVGGLQTNNAAASAGAVYVYLRMGSVWMQQAYIKASNTATGDSFGRHVALSANGNTLVVGTEYEDSNATGVGGLQSNNAATESGAIYAFTRSGVVWTQEAYIKASNTGMTDFFAWDIGLSADGNTLAVAAKWEDSNATGIDGAQGDNSAMDAGAVYVFTRAGVVWTQQAYIKASNTGSLDYFGSGLALSSDGNTLAIGANGEASTATGIGGDQSNNGAAYTGAVYVFTRAGVVWTQQAYVKASNAGGFDSFGDSVALSSDGSIMAVGATSEDSNATGVNGDQTNSSAASSGAAYVFTRAGSTWTQEAYIKASNTNSSDQFGNQVSLSSDGTTIAVSAIYEQSNATGVGGDQSNNTLHAAGAVYVFAHSGSMWTQVAYVKATNTGADDYFGGKAVALSSDGSTLAVGSAYEDSNATGIGGDQSNNALSSAGAAYVYSVM